MKAANLGMVSGRWHALLRGPDALPCLFGSRADAEDNRDQDEYLVAVHVRPLSMGDLLRGERAVLERRRAAQAVKRTRQRVPDEQKRRRGSGATLAVAKDMSALKKMAPAERRRFVQAFNAGALPESERLTGFGVLREALLRASGSELRAKLEKAIADALLTKKPRPRLPAEQKKRRGSLKPARSRPRVPDEQKRRRGSRG